MSGVHRQEQEKLKSRKTKSEQTLHTLQDVYSYWKHTAVSLSSQYILYTCISTWCYTRNFEILSIISGEMEKQFISSVLTLSGFIVCVMSCVVIVVCFGFCFFLSCFGFGLPFFSVVGLSLHTGVIKNKIHCNSWNFNA